MSEEELQNIESEVTVVMNEWREATLNGDLEVFGAILADDYSESAGGTKEGILRAMEGQKKRGTLGDMEIEFSGVSIEVGADGKSAVFGPFLASMRGSAVPPIVRFTTLEQRDGKWLMVRTESRAVID
jgi:hypothetical protein